MSEEEMNKFAEIVSEKVINKMVGVFFNPLSIYAITKPNLSRANCNPCSLVR